MGVVGVYDKVLGERSLLLAKSCVTQALGDLVLEKSAWRTGGSVGTCIFIGSFLGLRLRRQDWQ
jgi:hypothetical protein